MLQLFVQKNRNVNLTFTESLNYHLTTKIRAERKNCEENQKERKDCFIEPQLVWCATLYHFWRIFLVSFDPGALSPKWATNWNKWGWKRTKKGLEWNKKGPPQPPFTDEIAKQYLKASHIVVLFWSFMFFPVNFHFFLFHQGKFLFTYSDHFPYLRIYT